MKINEDPAQAANTIERIKDMMNGERAEGTHVSDLIFCLRKSKARKQGLFPDQSPSDTLIFAVGHAIQAYLVGGGAETKVYRDGVHGSVDWVDEDGIPWEIKATYASSARDIKDSKHYFDQLGSYCYMLGKTCGYLAILYINGAYSYLRKKKPGEPQVQNERAILKVYKVEWEQEELQAKWNILTWNKLEFERAAMWQELPARPAFDWECNYCTLYQTGECPGGKSGR